MRKNGCCISRKGAKPAGQAEQNKTRSESLIITKQVILMSLYLGNPSWAEKNSIIPEKEENLRWYENNIEIQSFYFVSGGIMIRASIVQHTTKHGNHKGSHSDFRPVKAWRTSDGAELPHNELGRYVPSELSDMGKHYNNSEKMLWELKEK